MTEANAVTHPAVLALLGIAVALTVVLLFRARGNKPQDVFSLLDLDPTGKPKQLVAPVDLSRPINTEYDWRAIQAHARDAAYQSAVETVRNRYKITSNPLLLSNTLQTTMDRWGLSFREAMIRVAEDDGLR